MELIYMWVKEYNGFLNQGFNFSAEYIFHYDLEKKSLIARKNELYIEDFFNLQSNSPDANTLTAKIKNISAIIGENGTGKSSVIELIKKAIQPNNLIDSAIESIIIYKECDRREIIHHNNLSIQKGNYHEFNFQIVERYHSKFSDRKTTFFYSNIFDSKREIENSNVINLSTNYLLQHDSTSNSNQLQTHREKEIYRQAYFISRSEQALRSKIPFELPEFITATITNSRDKKNIFSFKEYPLITECILQVKEELKEKLKDKTSKPVEFTSDDVTTFLWIVMIDQYIDELIRYKFDSYDLQKIDGLCRRVKLSHFNDPNKKAHDFFVQIFTKSENEENQSMNFQSYISNVKSIVKFCKFFGTLLRKPSNSFSFDGEEINLNINLTYRGILYDFIKYYGRTVVNSTDYLRFDWKDLSSGQKALLTLYSRFFYYKFVYSLSHEIIILIDEGEVYFHPQWQKELILNLVEFFSQLFRVQLNNEQRLQVQIILTSNSPFVVSDLPSHNIVFLKKEEPSTVVIDGLEDAPETFASNIHSLLAHSFFLKDGSIGHFARGKINAIINILVNGTREEVLRNKELIEKTIRIIGEPIVRNKLLQMLEERMIFDLMTIRSDMTELRSRLDALEIVKN